MDIIPFIRFTLDTRYMLRWITVGIVFYIPVLNFFSLGYLSNVSRILMIGSLGLPTWEKKNEVWMEGIKLLFIFILYEAVPFFLFASGFFLNSLSTVTAFFGNIIIKLSYLGIFLFSFLLPFAFAIFSERLDFRKALEFERIIPAIREVFFPYVSGYMGSMAALYACSIIARVPYIGFILSSILTYYVFLLSTFYFTRLYVKTSLSPEKIIDVISSEMNE